MHHIYYILSSAYRQWSSLNYWFSTFWIIQSLSSLTLKIDRSINQSIMINRLITLINDPWMWWINQLHQLWNIMNISWWLLKSEIMVKKSSVVIHVEIQRAILIMVGSLFRKCLQNRKEFILDENYCSRDVWQREFIPAAYPRRYVWFVTGCPCESQSNGCGRPN